MDFKLERTDGTPADPPTYRTGVLRGAPATRSRSAQPGRSVSWRFGATIPKGPAVLVVEDVA